MPSLEERAEALVRELQPVLVDDTEVCADVMGVVRALILKALRDAQAEALEEEAEQVEAESPHTNWDPVAKQLRTRAATLRREEKTDD